MSEKLPVQYVTGRMSPVKLGVVLLLPAAFVAVGVLQGGAAGTIFGAFAYVAFSLLARWGITKLFIPELAESVQANRGGDFETGARLSGIAKDRLMQSPWKNTVLWILQSNAYEVETVDVLAVNQAAALLALGRAAEAREAASSFLAARPQSRIVRQWLDSQEGRKLTAAPLLGRFQSAWLIAFWTAIFVGPLLLVSLWIGLSRQPSLAAMIAVLAWALLGAAWLGLVRLTVAGPERALFAALKRGDWPAALTGAEEVQRRHESDPGRDRRLKLIGAKEVQRRHESDPGRDRRLKLIGASFASLPIREIALLNRVTALEQLGRSDEAWQVIQAAPQTPVLSLVRKRMEAGREHRTGDESAAVAGQD